jgi:hypothetical protein
MAIRRLDSERTISLVSGSLACAHPGSMVGLTYLARITFVDSALA